MWIEARTLTVSAAYRPETHFFTEQDLRLVLLMTIWGNGNLLQDLKDAFMTGYRKGPNEVDPDMTQMRIPVKPIKQSVENSYARLADGVRSMNSFLATKENSRTWRTVVEVAAVQITNNTCHWVVNSGFQFLLRSSNAHSVLFQAGNGIHPWSPHGELPLNGIGLDDEYPLSQGFAQISEDTQLVAVGASQLPRGLMQDGMVTLDSLADEVLRGENAQPHWIGLIRF